MLFFNVSRVSHCLERNHQNLHFDGIRVLATGQGRLKPVPRVPAPVVVGPYNLVVSFRGMGEQQVGATGYRHKTSNPSMFGRT